MLLLLFNLVADTPDPSPLNSGAPAIDSIFTNMADVNGYGYPHRWPSFFIPDLLIDLAVNGEHLSGIFNEEQRRMFIHRGGLRKFPHQR